MIKFEEYDNTKYHLSCNACCKGYEGNNLYELTFPTGSNSSLVIRLCKDCAKELRDSIKFRK